MGLNILMFIVCGAFAFVFIVIAIISACAYRHSDKKTENAFIQQHVPKLKDCGECGCNTCELFVDKVRRKKESIYKCPYVTLENKREVSKYFEKSEVVEKNQVAVVHCKGGCRCETKFEYKGDLTCASLNSVDYGNKKCDKACLGCGDCAKVCPVDAIFINKFGTAEIDRLRCVGCGACVTACPDKLIEMIPSKQVVASICATPNQSKNCSVGCNGCGLCVANCPKDAISINDGVVTINAEKCNGCLNCVRVCPTHTISRI